LLLPLPGGGGGEGDFFVERGKAKVLLCTLHFGGRSSGHFEMREGGRWSSVKKREDSRASRGTEESPRAGWRYERERTFVEQPPPFFWKAQRPAILRKKKEKKKKNYHGILRKGREREESNSMREKKCWYRRGKILSLCAGEGAFARTPFLR